MNEGEDLFAEGPVCDFCEIAVEPDETLEPIYVGELPQPKPHYIQNVGRRGGMRGGRYKAKYDVLRRALHDCPDIDLNESDVVHELEALGGESHFLTKDEMMEHGSKPGVKQGIRGDADFTTKRTEKVGVTLKIRPKDVTYTPDAEVCDTCAEMFKGLGDE